MTAARRHRLSVSAVVAGNRSSSADHDDARTRDEDAVRAGMGLTGSLGSRDHSDGAGDDKWDYKAL